MGAVKYFSTRSVMQIMKLNGTLFLATIAFLAQVSKGCVQMNAMELVFSSVEKGIEILEYEAKSNGVMVDHNVLDKIKNHIEKTINVHSVKNTLSQFSNEIESVPVERIIQYFKNCSLVSSEPCSGNTEFKKITTDADHQISREINPSSLSKLTKKIKKDKPLMKDLKTIAKLTLMAFAEAVAPTIVVQEALLDVKNWKYGQLGPITFIHEQFNDDRRPKNTLTTKTELALKRVKNFKYGKDNKNQEIGLNAAESYCRAAESYCRQFPKANKDRLLSKNEIVSLRAQVQKLNEQLSKFLENQQ